jgi:tektin-3
MWSSWNNTNTALQQRVHETTDAHNKLQTHLSKTMQEIYDQVIDQSSYREGSSLG